MALRDKYVRQLNKTQAAVLLLLVLGVGACSRKFVVRFTHDVSSGDWTLFGGQPGRTSFHPQTISPPLTNLWTHKASSAVGPTLVVADGILILTTLDGRLEAIDIESGDRVSKTKLNGPYESTCAYFERHLFIAQRYGDKTLARYDLASGKYRWTADAGDIASEPLVVKDGVYISAQYGHIDKYDVETGHRIWRYEADAQMRSSPALSQGIVVVGSDDGTIYAVNATKGSLVWQYKACGSVFATPVIDGGKVFVGALDSVFYCLTLRSGNVDWQYKTAAPIYQTAATDGNSVLFGTTDGVFYSLNVATGTLEWRFMAQSVVSTAPLICGDLVYWGSLDRKYYCLELRTGKELWNFTTHGRIRTSPVAWGDYILGASENKYVYAFHSPSSTPIASD